MKSAIAGATLALVLAASPAVAQNVKITPVGSHPGELCANDRATIFEDPTGVRLLYDAGQTVTGADDPRLGTIHVVLLSHAHGDHIGDQKLKALGAGRVRELGAGPGRAELHDRGNRRGEERGDRDDERHGDVHRPQGPEHPG